MQIADAAITNSAAVLVFVICCIIGFLVWCFSPNKSSSDHTASNGHIASDDEEEEKPEDLDDISYM